MASTPASRLASRRASGCFSADELVVSDNKWPHSAKENFNVTTRISSRKTKEPLWNNYRHTYVKPSSLRQLN